MFGENDDSSVIDVYGVWKKHSVPEKVQQAFAIDLNDLYLHLLVYKVVGSVESLQRFIQYLKFDDGLYDCDHRIKNMAGV